MGFVTGQRKRVSDMARYIHSGQPDVVTAVAVLLVEAHADAAFVGVEHAAFHAVAHRHLLPVRLGDAGHVEPEADLVAGRELKVAARVVIGDIHALDRRAARAGGSSG